MNNTIIEDFTNERTVCEQATPTAQSEEECHRRLLLCKRCELALRGANYFVKALGDGAKRPVRGCNICHTRTACRDFTVSTEPTMRREVTPLVRHKKSKVTKLYDIIKNGAEQKEGTNYGRRAEQKEGES